MDCNLVHAYMLMRGSAEDNNHNPTLYIYWVITPWSFS